MARKFDGEEIVLATHNKGKIPEIKALFGDLVKKFSIASDYDLPSPPETGTTFVENAVMKAQFVAQETGKIALSDDSGLCVDALDGAPGVYSADWAEKPDGTRDFKMAMEMVLEKMGDTPDRKAHFTSCLALVWPDGHVEYVEGYVHGTITKEMRGTKGFGYDPIFIADDHPGQTFGEMEAEFKNSVSHRADAFKKLKAKCF